MGDATTDKGSSKINRMDLGPATSLAPEAKFQLVETQSEPLGFFLIGATVQCVSTWHTQIQCFKIPTMGRFEK